MLDVLIQGGTVVFTDASEPFDIGEGRPHRGLRSAAVARSRGGPA
jgi:hypothetical protein